jgi:hypothetical protein
MSVIEDLPSHRSRVHGDFGASQVRSEICSSGEDNKMRAAADISVSREQDPCFVRANDLPRNIVATNRTQTQPYWGLTDLLLKSAPAGRRCSEDCGPSISPRTDCGEWLASLQ